MELESRLELCLRGKVWEVIFVDDDSPDGTAARIREIARRDPRVRCLQRIGRRGRSSACIEGMLASSCPYLKVIDGDTSMMRLNGWPWVMGLVSLMLTSSFGALANIGMASALAGIVVGTVWNYGMTARTRGRSTDQNPMLSNGSIA